jgi:hypothetical protein
VGTIKSRVNRARAKLAEIMSIESIDIESVDIESVDDVGSRSNIGPTPVPSAELR